MYLPIRNVSKVIFLFRFLIKQLLTLNNSFAIAVIYLPWSGADVKCKGDNMSLIDALQISLYKKKIFTKYMFSYQ